LSERNEGATKCLRLANVLEEIWTEHFKVQVISISLELICLTEYISSQPKLVA
jgi:hypothetical protein